MLKDRGLVRETAVRLADANREAEPSITEIWFFPDDQEVRLIELNPVVEEGVEEIAPFHFSPDPLDAIFYPIAVALLNPQDHRRLKLPEGWGTWEQAERLYPRD